ncbi:MAG: hypothetical protein RL244_1537 [Pseudomonadota bacterium]
MAKVAITAGWVTGFKSPPDKKQAFLWDATTPGLGLHKTPSGKPAYVFQAPYQGQDIRITIGSPDAWPIPEMQAKVRELQRLIDGGQDPCNLKRDAIATAQAKQQQAKLQALTVGEVWATYIEARSPHACACATAGQEKLEAWILEQAGIDMPLTVSKTKLTWLAPSGGC